MLHFDNYVNHYITKLGAIHANVMSCKTIIPLPNKLRDFSFMINTSFRLFY